ncbi:aryl-sulfate sulfotransferase [Winogradskyella ursingii]|uniref:aryl-sulfate sulfotransferase n=1 Tax=Winogradskyella ursingii TaxID=2686079 RepID=UPI001C549D60|nr:aryl-sulfate sulfotransferase [Winogradskyella ursingii]
MKKIYFFTLIFSINLLQSQNTVGTITITEDVNDAFTLFTVHTKSYLINNCGEVINQWDSNYPPGNAVYLLENGNLLRAGRLNDGSSNITFPGTGGIVELFDWDGNVLWSYTYSSNDFRQHHDVYPMPNGNVLILAATLMSQSEAIQAGRNPNLLQDGELYNEQIIEVEPIGTNQANIVWEWNIKDHLIQDFDSTKDNFGNVSENQQLLDINYTNNGSGSNNWLHLNSIQYNQARDQIIISSRNLSEIWIIDHSTSTSEAATSSGGIYNKGGDFLYRWGNPEVYRQGTLNDRKLFGQHTPYFIEPGLPNEDKIIIFNNGNGRTPNFSQIDIISPPETSFGVYDYAPNTAYEPTNPDYTYSDLSSDPSEFFSGIVSSAQQLDNGNILICEGREGHFFEINSNGEKVWEYINPISSNNGTSTSQGDSAPADNLTFRAFKYNMDYPGFIGRDLTPGPTLELNPDLTSCNSLSISNFEESIVKVFPNPSKNKIEINAKIPIDKIDIYNALGRRMNEIKSSKIDLSEYAEGIYYLKIYSGSRIINKKVIKN